MPEVCHLLFGVFWNPAPFSACNVTAPHGFTLEREVESSLPGAYSPPRSMNDCHSSAMHAFPVLTSLRQAIRMQ
jgi:hypothetical protein